MVLWANEVILGEGVVGVGVEVEVVGGGGGSCGQCVKVFTTKPDNSSLIFGTHMVGENCLSQIAIA